MKPAGRYTSQLQAGLGMIDETRLLLDLWQPGMATSELYQQALQSGQLPNISARRLRNVVHECFAPRYLSADAVPATNLKRLSKLLSSPELKQLFFLYTCRANLILADFVRTVYWQHYAAGADRLSTDEVRAFIERGMDDGKTVKRWAKSTVRRVSSYLTGSCIDYGLLSGRTANGCRIAPYRIEPRIAAYLAYDLHFSKLGDNTITAHPDWQLFGMATEDVRDELRRLSLKGLLVYQSAGKVTHIGWIQQDMKELIDVLAQG